MAPYGRSAPANGPTDRAQGAVGKGTKSAYAFCFAPKRGRAKSEFWSGAVDRVSAEQLALILLAVGIYGGALLVIGGGPRGR